MSDVDKAIAHLEAIALQRRINKAQGYAARGASSWIETQKILAKLRGKK
jgi:hypothetical protein